MYGNILQQEQNRKDRETNMAGANQAAKTEGLLSMLKGGKKKKSIQEKHGELRAKGFI